MNPLRTLASRYGRALITLPSLRLWAAAGGLLILYAVVVGGMDVATGLIAVRPASAKVVQASVIGVLIAPAFVEESVYRGFLPNWSETRRPGVWIAVSVAIFVAYHGVLTLFLPGARPIFLRADFLISSAWLGVTCASLRMKSGSLWPGVVFHWAVVFTWLALLGGPTPARLLHGA